MLPYDGNSAPRPVSDGGGTEPGWSREGSEIFYRNGNTMMAVDVRTTPRFEVTGAPRPLFLGPYDFSNDNNWDVFPDGRFVMVKSNPNIGREIRVVSNWFEELDTNGGR